MKNTKYSRILDSLTEGQMPQHLDLAPKILKRIQKNNGAGMNRRMKVLVPTVVVLVMLAVVIFTVPAVAQAIQRWIGYVPGFGMVQDDRLRTLAEPVSLTKDGVTLAVNSVTASSDKTLVKYSLMGVTDSMITGREICPGNQTDPVIKLPDGSVMKLQGLATSYGAAQYQFEAMYSAIPAEVMKAIFSLHCLWQTNSAARTWSFDIPIGLTFDSKTALTVAPVIEVSTSTAQTEMITGTEPAGVKANLQVNQIVPLENGYILAGSMAVDPVSGLTVDESDGYLDDITIVDADNKPLTLSMAPDDFIIEGMGSPGNTFNWALQISGKDIAWPLTITVNSVKAVTEPYAPSNFTMDVGSDPKPNQVLSVDQDVALGPNLVHVVSVRRMKEQYFDGYEFTFVYNPNLEFSIQIENCNPNGGGGQGGLKPGETVSLARSCRSAPTGVLNVTLSGNGVEPIRGPWQVSVAEPVEPTQ